ncbi:M28 family metallopeptidase [Allosphingosinicella indica]|uniref:Zn-dependent amino-or carboxypeptidase, M28 family n=1 Tax=Allosphingosinicella indica TaxID=941907 RepID=A0A1X7GDM9_9SPHN|nr:M28 family metallopeptidase [Allosphingosinicella indica]SMF67485.1 Zn-dependent amino-or carboxypeptidase, M28 family [Allosphingosinicella indica]
MRLAFAAVAAALLASAAPAQAPAQPEFSADRVKADIEFLADDLLEGRDTGTRGYDIAAHFVATRFESMGLKPASKDGWYQEVRFRETKLADPAPVLTIGGKSYENGPQVLMGPSAFETSQTIAGLPVVFAGYGLHAPDRGIDDYAGLDVKGKVVAVLSGFPKGMASDIGAHLATDKGSAAERQGAVGMVSILTPEALKVAPWALRQRYAGEPGFTWLKPDGQPFDDAPGLRFGAQFNEEAAANLFAGAPRSLKTVLGEAAKAGGKPKGFALKQTVGITRASAHSETKSPNVIAMLPGSDPALANEYVLLMAHLDHEGIDAKKADGDRIYNGAMDNASGVATMLEAARAFVASGVAPKRPILFAAVTAEEKGLLGAQYLAKYPAVPAPGKVVAVVNLDMPVLLYDFTDVVAFGAEHSTLGPIVDRATASAGVKLSPDPMPEQNLFTRSDHYRFVQEGVPSVFLMTGFANGGEKIFKDFLATHYHKVSDQTDLPFDWNAAAKFARINYAIAREIADAPEAPRWYQDSFFGDTFAKDAPKAAKAGK